MTRDLTPDDLHGFVLQRAFRTMTSHPEMINIRASNNKVVAFNRDVLILFSNFVRNILSDLPCCSSNVTPVILLPSISASVLIKLQDILHQGHCDETLDVHESSELLDAAASLGLDIKKFYVGKEKTGSAVREALVNLDNVNSNSKEIKSIIEQKQREGNQVVLMKTSKSRGNMSASAKSSLSVSSMIPPSTPTPMSQPSPRPTAEPNSSSQPQATPTRPREASGESANQQPMVKTAPLSFSKASSASKSSSSSMVSPLTMPVKQERREEEAASAKTTNPPPEPMEEDQPRQQAPAPAPQQQPTGAASSGTDQNPALEYKCEVKNCNKPFSTVILLKYHYCSHFMSMLKKNHEHLLDNSNSCKDCKKNFQNSRRLLLHIGVNHDKINEILRSRGYKELPAHSASMLQQAVATKAAEKAAAAAEKEKGVFDVRKILDVKNVPLIPTPRRTSETESKESSSSQSSSVASSSGISTASSSESSKTSSPAPPGPPASSDTSASSESSSKTAEDKEKTEANCNYELECQVIYSEISILISYLGSCDLNT